MATTTSSSRRTRKIAAIAAGILVVGVAATYTLASWNDSEWVWGGAGNDPGIGTSQFNIQQDTSVTFVNADWTDEDANPGGGLTFTTGALALAPGDTVYAPVALRADSTSVAGTVTLQAAESAASVTVNDPSDGLWGAVDVTVYTQNAAADPFSRVGTCDEAGVAGSEWTPVAGVTKLNTSATASQPLKAAAGDVQHYCFAVGLAADAETTFAGANSGETLQGRTIAPAWEFEAVSN